MSSSSTVDEADKIKEQWAFNMPCVLLVNGRDYWVAKLKSVYELIYKDMLISVRKSLAAGLIELARLIDVKTASHEDQKFLIDVLNHFLSDVDEVRYKVMPHLCAFISMFPEDKQTMLLQTLIRDRIESEKGKKSSQVKVELLQNLFAAFPVQTLVDCDFHHYLYNTIKDDPVSVHLRSDSFSI